MNEAFTYCFLSLVLHHSLKFETVLKDVRGKIKEWCLSFDCLESISIVNDGSIGKLCPINLNSFMVNAVKQESSAQLAKVWICFNKLNKKGLKLSFIHWYYLGSMLY